MIYEIAFIKAGSKLDTDAKLRDIVTKAIGFENKRPLYTCKNYRSSIYRTVYAEIDAKRTFDIAYMSETVIGQIKAGIDNYVRLSSFNMTNSLLMPRNINPIYVGTLHTIKDPSFFIVRPCKIGAR